MRNNPALRAIFWVNGISADADGSNKIEISRKFLRTLIVSDEDWRINEGPHHRDTLI